MEEFDVIKIKDGVREHGKSPVTEEVPLTIEVNGAEAATLLSSPTALDELVIGFLFTSGLIAKASDILSLTIDTQRWKASVDIADSGLPEGIAFKRIYTSGCGKGLIFHSAIDLMQRIQLPAGFSAKAEHIEALTQEFRRISTEYRETSGVHSAALADAEKIIVVRDDIGRHNALDKIIGRALMDRILLNDKIILTSGRISSEIITKVVRSGATVLASAKAPTNQAIRYALQTNLTVAGFVRSGKMSVYSGAERIA